MFVNPITPLQSITSSNFVSAIKPIQSIMTENDKSQDTLKAGSGYTFTDMLKSLIENAQATSAQTKVDSFNLALGLTEDADLHNIEINAVKADLALRTMVSVRNKVLDAYTEVMRITV